MVGYLKLDIATKIRCYLKCYLVIHRGNTPSKNLAISRVAADEPKVTPKIYQAKMEENVSMGRYSQILKGQGQKQGERVSKDAIPQTKFKLIPLKPPPDCETYYYDPRPDLTEDHELWIRILTEAYWYCQGDARLEQLYGSLHGLRCGGAKVQRMLTGNLKLLPGEWQTMEWKQATAKYLGPFKEDIKAILLLAQSTKVDLRELPAEIRQWLGIGGQTLKISQKTLF